MAKLEQVLNLDPASELHFIGPFTDVVTSYLKLTNPLDQHVCFKVKTTAPKRYCVRPNSGMLSPKQVINVAVMLQPFEYNPNEKNKHKFMVQTLIVPDGEGNIENLWRDAKPESLMDSKLRCVFDMPANENADNNNVETNEAHGDEKIGKVAPEIRETMKSYPKANNAEVELKKVLEDNKRLKEEVQLIKQENAQLKAEGLRLRSRGSATTDAGSQLSGSHIGGNAPKPFNDKLAEQPQSPMLFLAVILTIGLMGIFIGKFVV